MVAGAAVSVSMIAGGVVWASASDRGVTGTAISAPIVERSDESVFTPAAPPVVSLDVVAESGQEFAGASPRRLPSRADLLWSYDIVIEESFDVDGEFGDDAETIVEVVDDRWVVLVSGGGGLRRVDGSTLDVFDAESGALVWSDRLATRADGVRIIGVVDDVLMLQSALNKAEVTGYNLATGEVLWTLRDDLGLEELAGLSRRFDVEPGTRLLARYPNLADNPTLLFDPLTGLQVASIAGERLGTDRLGNVFVADGGQVATYDFAVGSPFPARVDPVDPSAGVVGVVDGQIVTATDGRLDVSGSIERVGTERLPSSIAHIEAMVGPTFLLTGAGEIVGARLDDGAVTGSWASRGVLVQTAGTVRGVVLVVATDGGGSQRIVDGRNGETIAALTMVPGVFDGLVFAGNGIVTRRTSPEGQRIAALDLDGNEVWSLPGPTAISVGDGFVARVENGEGGPVLAVYGELRA